MYKDWKLNKKYLFGEFELSKENNLEIETLKQEYSDENELQDKITQYRESLQNAWEKEIQEKQDEYRKVAEWCNENGYRIDFDGEYYKTAKNVINPEYLKQSVKEVRNSYITDISNRLDRYRNQKEAGLETSDSEEIYVKLLQYLQYLRNYPESSEDWYKQNPKTFEEWS